MLKLLSLIAIIVFLVIGVLLGLLNPTLVEVDYYFNRLQLPLSILLSISFALGMLLAGLVAMFQLTRLHWRLNRVNKASRLQANEILALKKQIHKLNVQPNTEVATHLIKLPE